MGGKGSGHWRHRGRKGKRGGSAPSKGRGLVGKKLSAPTGEKGRDGNFAVEEWLEENVGLGLPGATGEERSNLKAQVARELAEASGVTEQEAADFVGQWARSSNDDDMRSLSIQQDAAKEFGVELSDFTKAKVNSVAPQKERYIQGAMERSGWSRSEAEKYAPAGLSPLMESDKQRAVLRAMYNETQAELKSRGITEVRLSRGVGLTPDLYELMNDSQENQWALPIKTNSVESWSISSSVGSTFALAKAGDGQVGVVFESIVPAERILSIPATGFGCLTEGEVVVLGGVMDDFALPVEVIPPGGY